MQWSVQAEHWNLHQVFHPLGAFEASAMTN
jgi:hypothetical protein